MRFIKKMVDNDWLVNVKRFQEFHSRLGFSAQVLPFFFALCCLGKIPGGAPFSQLHKSGNGSRVDRP